jgi:hypothetical protein
MLTRGLLSAPYWPLPSLVFGGAMALRAAL